MPTDTGLPKVGEVWERVYTSPRDQSVSRIRFVVLARGRGDYWSLRVYVPGHGRLLWVDPANWFRLGQLQYIGPAGPETKRKLSLA
jgi:hypothetical protein